MNFFPYEAIFIFAIFLFVSYKTIFILKRKLKGEIEKKIIFENFNSSFRPK
jgi:hypothetical protein